MTGYTYLVQDAFYAAHQLGNLINENCIEAIAANDVFRLGVSGGSILNLMEIALSKVKETHLKKFKIFFCDERYVPESDDDSTIGSYKRTLLPKIPLLEEQFIGINTNLTLKECAQDYEEKILKEFGMVKGDLPQFDMLLVSFGPDGHTCSLFPNHPLLEVKNRLIAYLDDSPKPPPKRVTMTFPLINSAKKCMIVLVGDGKAEIAKRVLDDKEVLPGGMIKPYNDDIYYLMDHAATKLWQRNDEE